MQNTQNMYFNIIYMNIVVWDLIIDKSTMIGIAPTIIQKNDGCSLFPDTLMHQ